MVKLHFLKRQTSGTDLRSLKMNVDLDAESNYFHHLLSDGILAMLPSDVHFYLSLPHTDHEVDTLISSSKDFLRTFAH